MLAQTIGHRDAPADAVPCGEALRAGRDGAPAPIIRAGRGTGVRHKIHQLYEESGGFGALLWITTDSEDAGWDRESVRLLMEQVAPHIAHLGSS